jgi:hypothetical protein
MLVPFVDLLRSLGQVEVGLREKVQGLAFWILIWHVFALYRAAAILSTFHLRLLGSRLLAGFSSRFAIPAMARYTFGVGLEAVA